MSPAVCLQARAGDGGASSHGQWFCFDDVSVEPWDIINMDKDCFGGKYSLNPQHFKGPHQVYRNGAESIYSAQLQCWLL